MNKTRTQQTRGKVYEDFGEKIQQLRVSKNLTQEELSKLIGISRTNIGQYETGVRKVPLNIILVFAKFFDVSVDYLLDIEIDNEENTKQLTKYEVATELGFTNEEISILENSKEIFPLSILEKFAKYFDVDIEQLMELDVSLDKNKKSSAIVSTDPEVIRQMDDWNREVGAFIFTKEQHSKLMSYAKFLRLEQENKL